MMVKPTAEQQVALELFKTGEGLRIDAFAGSGKTTTLQLLAEDTKRVGHYLAFNKSIATEAKRKFPGSVTCTTNHALAFRRVRTACHYSDWKMTNQANGNMVADVLQLPELIEFSCSKKLVLTARCYGSMLRDACRRYLHSTDYEPTTDHFPRYGKLTELTDNEYQQFVREALGKVRQLWDLMLNTTSRIPLGHDGYLKLWALSNPILAADYVMLDEAQDSNPVILGVLLNQPCQVVYVGDPYQQIYEWRGAVNAMETVATKHRAALTQSFRFGSAIANAASQVISRLGSASSISGNPTCESHVCPVHPAAILCRTNGGVIAHLMLHLRSGERCHILGGTSELQRWLEDVKKLKRGYPSDLPDFFGFASWNEVVAFAALPEGEHLKTIVKLVNDYGEDRILGAVRQCEQNEETTDVTLSTAHKAKGREWETVLLDNDFDSAFTKLLQPDLSNRTRLSNRQFESEMRLLYVAMTRAKLGVELPPTVMQFFGLQHTRSERLGTPRKAPPPPASHVRGERQVWPPHETPVRAAPLPLVQTGSVPRPRSLFGMIRDLFR